MKNSMIISALALGLGCLALGSCKDDDDPSTSTGRLQPQVEGALGPDNAPNPDARDRLDRAGRPAITAALISTFAPDVRDADRDAYNKSGQLNPIFRDKIRASLGVLDALDSICGNQLIAGEGDTRYTALANVLLDDQIYLHSEREAAPTYYLGLEAEAVQALQVRGGGGGGRAPGEDVIARSYSVLAAGVLSGVDDGVARDDAEHDPENFPFLAEPQ